MYYRVTGQWVEDVDFSLEADGKILKVINPDPGGLPNIPYDEKNTTDVPMTSKRLVFTVSLRYTQEIFVSTIFPYFGDCVADLKSGIFQSVLQNEAETLVAHS